MCCGGLSGLSGDLQDLQGLKLVIEDKHQNILAGLYVHVLLLIISFPSCPCHAVFLGRPTVTGITWCIDHGETLVKDVYPLELMSLLTHLYI